MSTKQSSKSQKSSYSDSWNEDRSNEHSIKSSLDSELSDTEFDDPWDEEKQERSNDIFPENNLQNKDKFKSQKGEQEKKEKRDVGYYNECYVDPWDEGKRTHVYSLDGEDFFEFNYNNEGGGSSKINPRTSNESSNEFSFMEKKSSLMSTEESLNYNDQNEIHPRLSYGSNLSFEAQEDIGENKILIDIKKSKNKSDEATATCTSEDDMSHSDSHPDIDTEKEIQVSEMNMKFGLFMNSVKTLDRTCERVFETFENEKERIKSKNSRSPRIKKIYDIRVKVLDELLKVILNVTVKLDDLILEVKEIKKKKSLRDEKKLILLAQCQIKLNRMESKMQKEIELYLRKGIETEQYYMWKNDEYLEEEKTIDVGINELCSRELICKQFIVMKYDPRKRLISQKKRVFEIDFFRNQVKNMTRKGKIQKRMEPQNLKLAERYAKPEGLRVYFSTARHFYELICKNNIERESLMSLISSIRPDCYTWCPYDGGGKLPNRVKMNIEGEVFLEENYLEKNNIECAVRRGKFSLNISRTPYESMVFWMGALDMKDEITHMSVLRKFVRVDRNFDMYILAFKNSPFKKSIELENYLNNCFRLKYKKTKYSFMPFVTSNKLQLAIMVKSEKKRRISNYQISNCFKNKKGAISISFFYHETKVLFINSNFSKEDGLAQYYKYCCSHLQHGYNNIPFYNQFNHIFWIGQFRNCENLIKKEGIFPNFIEPKIGQRVIEEMKFELGNLKHIDLKTRPRFCETRILKKSINDGECQCLDYNVKEQYEHFSSIFKIMTHLHFNFLFNTKKDIRLQFNEIVYIHRKNVKKQQSPRFRDKPFKMKIKFVCHFINVHCETITKKENEKKRWTEKEIPELLLNIPEETLELKEILLVCRGGNKNFICSGRFQLGDFINRINCTESEFSINCFNEGVLVGKLNGFVTLTIK